MYRTILCTATILFWLTTLSMAQKFNPDERIQGYAHRNDTTFFLFDPELYETKNTERVVLTGAFRGWSQDMNEPTWNLSFHNGLDSLWLLAVPNADFEVIGPQTPFKFRLNDGDWMDPPSEAPNAASGNLVFLHDVQPTRFSAELQTPRAIWTRITGDDAIRSLNQEDYRLTDAAGKPVRISAVLPHHANEALVIPAQPLDLRRVYYLERQDLGLRTFCSFDGWFRTLYSDKELGAQVSDDRTRTVFRIFAPRAELIRLYLYHAPDDQEAYLTLEMNRDENGVWETDVDADLHGVYYDFTAHGADDPGNRFYETDPVHISDPYARVNVDAFGKSRVWYRTTPATPLKEGIPRMEDVVAYEVHVQDFTDLLPVPDELKGTLPAMVTPGLRNSRGEPIGFDHLVNLGINVVHLLPVQEFLHYPDAVWQAAFGNDPYMQAQGIDQENYQWGYRTTHAFAIETRYRRKGTEYGDQREQFRDLVQAFHDRGIAVIVDFVFNHTGENMEGQDFLLNLGALDRHYYYRLQPTPTGDFEHIGPFGNETKSENRPMVQRWIIDQCKHFIEEFGVDGFRIDLAGVTDKQTLIALREALGPDTILYGEPWIASADPEVRDNPDWGWYKADAPLTFFQDDTRNAIQGPPSNPENKDSDRGWAGGNTLLREQVKLALTNGFAEEGDPNRGINYLDIHDDWTLADRFALNDWNGHLGVDEKPYKIAISLLLTSLGPVVLHGGSEIMRSKGTAPLIELVKRHDMGATYIHGKRDTYNLRAANRFIWEQVGQVKQEGSSTNDYRSMLAYWRGLIHFRLSEQGRPLRIGGQDPPANYYQWIEPEDPHLLGYLIDETILVLANTDTRAHSFEQVSLPAGTWKLIGNGTEVDHVHGVKGPYDIIDGDATYSLMVPAQTVLIWTHL